MTQSHPSLPRFTRPLGNLLIRIAILLYPFLGSRVDWMFDYYENKIKELLMSILQFTLERGLHSNEYVYVDSRDRYIRIWFTRGISIYLFPNQSMLSTLVRIIEPNTGHHEIIVQDDLLFNLCNELLKAHR